jgi:hypothetical protein
MEVIFAQALRFLEDIALYLVSIYSGVSPKN